MGDDLPVTPTGTSYGGIGKWEMTKEGTIKVTGTGTTYNFGWTYSSSGAAKPEPYTFDQDYKISDLKAQRKGAAETARSYLGRLQGSFLELDGKEDVFDLEGHERGHVSA